MVKRAPDGPAPAVRVAPAPLCPLRPLAGLTASVAAWSVGGEPLRLFTTLGRHPRLFRSWLWFSATLLSGAPCRRLSASS